jgi:SnoaL-like protein
MAKQMGQLLAMPMARLRERPMVLLVAALLQAGEEPHCYEEGSMGWVADRPRAVLPDGTISTRLTGVVVRQEEGEWRLVHIHLPTPAEALRGP